MDSNTSSSKPSEPSDTTDIAKETTSTASNSSVAQRERRDSNLPPPPTTANKDHCCVCLEDLPVDDAVFVRMTCCGKAIHLHCKDNFFGSSLSQEQKDKCPHCQVKLVSTEKELYELALGWADKGKAWAQAYVGIKYFHGRGVQQSYEKAIEYWNTNHCSMYLPRTECNPTNLDHRLPSLQSH